MNFLVINTDKNVIKSVWDDIDSAEAAANRMRSNSYVTDLEGLDSFKVAELQEIAGNHLPKNDERTLPGRKAELIKLIGELVEETDWSAKVVKRAGGGARNGACAKVHEIADSMPDAARKDVIAACVEAGINPATAATQYQKWRVAQQAA